MESVYSRPVLRTELILEKEPHELMYTARYMLYPLMFGDVLAFHDRFTLCVDAAVPVPVTVSVVVEGCALLVNVSVPLTDPVVEGLKVTVNVALFPARIVTGRDKPLILNTELFELAAVTVTFAPLAVKVPEAVPLDPT